MASLASRNSEADWAQLAPSATAVTTWRSSLVRTSPAANTPGIVVLPMASATI